MKQIWIFLMLMGAIGSVLAEQHLRWELQGAQERIEAHRKGDLRLELRLPDGSLVPAGAEFRLEQREHAFRFGGSLAADWQSG